ncbi:MAG: methyltransferase [Propionibacteriaceae bacterium]|nr:methyltransferase [Propionibacteriaceae bacterium]
MIVHTTDIAHGGWCVARHEGIVVFVSGALPQETVEIEITNKKSRMWYGHTVKVIEASPDRVTHVWPLAEETLVGGANLGHVSFEAGLRWKARVLETHLARLAHLYVDVNVEATGHDLVNQGLRWRTRLVVNLNDQGHVAMFGARSHQLIDIDSMPLAHERIQEQLATDSTGRHQGKKLHYVWASHSGLAVVGDSSTDVVHESIATAYGAWDFMVDARGFFQVHREAPRVLIEAVIDAVGETAGSVLDLYSGVGLFAIPLAEVIGRPVTAVEKSTAAVKHLTTNARDYQVEALAMDALVALEQTPPGAYSVIVCDPPRSGLGRRGVQLVAQAHPERVVYVACDPVALARDVGIFAELGYQMESLRGFDLFPLTHHVECVAVLGRTTIDP